MKIEVTKDCIGKRLDVFLTEVESGLSRSAWQKKIKNKEVLVGGEAKPANFKLKESSVVEFAGIEDNLNTSKEKEESGGYDEILFERASIIYEADDYIVVGKPSGVVVHRDGKYRSNTLVDWILSKYPEIASVGEDKDRPGIVHRLDKDVSGVMVIARTEKGFNHFKKQFKERKVDKFYKALVHGVVEKDEAEINLPIVRNKDKGYFVARTEKDENAKSAITQYKVEKRFLHFSLLEVRILTGRTHQIRVHLRSIGHSLVGDGLYATRDVRKGKVKNCEIDRIWLHANKLGFFDLNNKKQSFVLDIPYDLQELLDLLK